MTADTHAQNAAAKRLLRSLSHCERDLLAWIDLHRQDAEQRHHTTDSTEELVNDEVYGAALDSWSHTTAAIAELRALIGIDGRS